MVKLSFSRKRALPRQRTKKAHSIAVVSTSKSPEDDFDLDLVKRRALRRWTSYTPGCTVLISSRNPLEDLHRLFPSLPPEEFPLNVFTCALSKDILLQGKMFVSQNWICFYSNIFGFETRETIEMKEIIGLCRERTAFVVPNAISIQTPQRRFFFCSFLSRETVFRLLSRTWKAAVHEKKSCHSDDDTRTKKIGTLDEIDYNHNATRASVSECSFDTRGNFSDNDLDILRFSTPIFTKNSTHMYPAIVCKNSIRQQEEYRRTDLRIGNGISLCKWHTESDLRELHIVRNRQALKLWKRRNESYSPAITAAGHFDANRFYIKSAAKCVKQISNCASKTFNAVRHRLVNYMSIYFFISIIIIILGIMSLFLLYKINSLSQIFAERNQSYSPLCTSSNLKLSSSEQNPYSGKLKRVNDILSSNLKAVYKVQDSLKKLKKNLGP